VTLTSRSTKVRKIAISFFTYANKICQLLQISPPIAMKLIIIGFATSYKSTVAKHLSKKLNLPLFDVDKLIEEQVSMPISQIFAEYGEVFFRELESNIICDLATKPTGIVSCGGGSVLSHDFSNLTQNATVLWLKVDAKTAHKRLNGVTRPLFDNLTVSELSAKIAERNPLYAKYATMELDTSGKPSKQVVEEVCKLLHV
jgi:shikimate kinase